MRVGMESDMAKPTNDRRGPVPREGPVRPGSVLHRVLTRLAREVAGRLRPDASKGGTNGGG